MAYFQYSPTRVARGAHRRSTTAISMLDGGADHRLNGATNSKRNLTRSRMHPRGELPPIEQLR